MNLNISILTALLQKLEQPYTIEDNLMIIEPTSSQMLETLPGEWVDADRTTHLHVDLTTFDVISYMAETINQFAETI
jgi:hypothetical protein